MIFREDKQLEGRKGVSQDERLHDENDVDVEKAVVTPSNDVNDNVLHDSNEVPEDLKHSFPKPFLLCLCLCLKGCPKLNLICNLGSF